MDAEGFAEDVRAGRIDADRLVGVVVEALRGLLAARRLNAEQAERIGERDRRIAERDARVAELERVVAERDARIAELERRVADLERRVGGASSGRLEAAFSVRAEERRQAGRGGRKVRRKRPARCGRLVSVDKLALAVRTEKVYPPDVPPEKCRLSHRRPVWRIENGRAVVVAYEVYRGPGNRYGQVPGVLGRSEFGLEIVLTVAYLTYVVGLSFDKVCLALDFFQHLRLRKSQVDALLNRLSRHWEGEFETLCTLLANSAVVHADETGWSIHSVWAFLSEQVRVLFFGVRKDAATLRTILDPATFAGIVVSDDAAVYANFTRSQKCWAHLLRKAIRLTLLAPDDADFRAFADRLLEIYRLACRVKRDRRLGDAGRLRKVGELDEAVTQLCLPVWGLGLPPLEGPADDHRRLCDELMRLMLNRQLFTFVVAADVESPAGETLPVPGTNNESERTLRSPAQDRQTGRTSKTLRGARRRTVIVSVLESLRRHLPDFTLSSVLAEILDWSATGRSCFARLLQKLRLATPTTPVLDRLLPLPDG